MAVATACGVIETFETRLVGLQRQRPAERDQILGRVHRPADGRRGAGPTESGPGGSNGASTRTWCPSAMKRSASASMCLVTPPGYVHEYGDRIATRMRIKW